jgi:antitoxin (DNA-binding transcriptional repressor) of toxin-antitoxin stability system
MRQASIHETRTTLSQLVGAAEDGEEVILARAGKPVVQPVRLRPASGGIRIGLLKGVLPDGLVESIDQPWSPRDLDELFNGPVAP